MSASEHPNLTIKAFCQSCGAPHAFDPLVVGRKAKCTSCGYIFRVPRLSQSSPPGAPEADAAPSGTPDGLVGVPHEMPRHSETGVDPLAELANAEESGRSTAETRPVDMPFEAAVTPTEPLDTTTAVTALTVILGLFYIAVIAVVVILLEWLVGIFLALWILLPVAAVFGRAILSHIIFLLTGKASAA